MPKISSLVAAKRIDKHVFNLLIEVSNLVGNVEDCWPEIEDGLVETLISMKKPKYHEPQMNVIKPATSDEKVEKRDPLPVSENAALVLEKLYRKRFIGSNSVNIRTIRNNLCKKVNRVDEAIEELINCGFLEKHAKTDSYSLISSKTHEVEVIANTVRETHIKIGD